MQYDVKLPSRSERQGVVRDPRTAAVDIAAVGGLSTIAAVAFAAVLALMVAYGEVRVFQADGYKALYVGRWIAQHGVPHTNVLSAVDYGRRWVDGEWLAELIYYESWRLGGFAAAAILAAACIASAYMTLAALLRRRGLSAGWAMFFTACALLGLVNWAFVRSQDLALPLFATVLAICLTDSERARPGRRLVLLLPVLAIWANVHGSVLLGAAMAVAYLLWRTVTGVRAGSPRLALGCLGLACLVGLTPLMTPYGPGIVHYYLEFAGNSAQHMVSAEGQPPTFPGGAFFAVYIPVALVVWVTIRALVTHRSAPWLLLGACAITAIAASARIGNLPWQTMVAALLIAELSKPWLARRRARTSPLIAVSVVAAVLSVAIVGSLALRTQAGYEAQTPLVATGAAAARAAEHPCWLILADNLDSAALEWHDPWLAGRIAFDARVELFSPPAMRRWAVFRLGRSSRWLSTTQGYQLLLGSTEPWPALVRRLLGLRGGVTIAHDSLGVAVINTQAVTEDGPRCSHL